MTTKRKLLRNIRQFCSECMGGPRAKNDVWPVPNPGDIAECTDYDCVYFEYRFGVDPYPNPRKVEIVKNRCKNLTPEHSRKVLNGAVHSV